MLTQNDLRQKFRMVPGGQPVMFTPMNPVGTQFQVDGARKQGIARPDELISAGMRINNESRIWILPAVNMGTVRPEPGDKIDDGVNTWRVEGNDKAMICVDEIEFKVVCNQER